MIIAVDFDGTIVEHKYPEIGRELPFAIETLKNYNRNDTALFCGVYGKVNYYRRPWISAGSVDWNFMP